MCESSQHLDCIGIARLSGALLWFYFSSSLFVIIFCSVICYEVNWGFIVDMDVLVSNLHDSNSLVRYSFGNWNWCLGSSHYLIFNYSCKFSNFCPVK